MDIYLPPSICVNNKRCVAPHSNHTDRYYDVSALRNRAIDSTLYNLPKISTRSVLSKVCFRHPDKIRYRVYQITRVRYNQLIR